MTRYRRVIITSTPVSGSIPPANVHYGFSDGVAQKRSNTLSAARAKHPHRFGTASDPKILALPGPAWINKPTETAEKTAA